MFVISLAFCDLTFLLFRLVVIVYAWLQMFAPETIRYVRPNSLFWVTFSDNFQRAGGWFIIVIIIERIIAVWFPFNIRDISTRKRAKGIILFVIITIFIGSGPGNAASLFNALTERIPKTGPVSTQREGTRYMKTRSTLIGHWQNITKVLFDIIPIPLVITLNLLVIIGIRRSVSLISKQLRNLRTARQKQQQRITYMLLTVAIAYCLLCGPYTLYSTLVLTRVIHISDVPNIASEIFRLLVTLNSTINFVIYGVTDKSVRQDYVRLLRCERTTSSTNNFARRSSTSTTYW